MKCRAVKIRRKKTSPADPVFFKKNAGAETAFFDSGGTSLASRELGFFNNRMGHNFSDVKIHTGPQASASAASFNAHAYTYGNNIVFNEGQYQPSTKEGKKLLAHELTHVVQQRSNAAQVSRKIKVPFEKFRPFNSKHTQTQGKVVENFFNQLCVEGGFTVTGGFVNEPVDLCSLPGPLGKNPAMTGAEQSKTKTGCTCLCDLIRSDAEVKIIINDAAGPNTLQDDEKADIPGVGGGSTVTTHSPDATPMAHPTKSGGLTTTTTPLIILGHELCGHAWHNSRGAAGLDHEKQRGRGGHQATVERENLIRDEQGIERRATFREPYCGERDDHYRKECKKWREEYNRLNGTSYGIEDTIPEDIFGLEQTPADFRQEVYFNKDTPQPWFNPAASFNVSVTAQGKENFSFSWGTLKERPTTNFQLEAHASSDKPAGDPTYNDRLSERRVKLILSELEKQGIDKSRLKDKADSGCTSIEPGMKNCSDAEAGAPGTAADRKVVIRIF